jgi:hypothetical protein
MPIRRALLGLVVAVSAASGQIPTQLGDKEFWQLFTSMSEQGGSFPSENFISNELTYQYVIPALQRATRQGDIYLGVGPEQNFTYIANLKPKMAIIFDIRRQNAMAHLMYKALFELSPTRADFLSHLFSRPLVARVNTGATPAQLFDALTVATPNDSAYGANEKAILDRLMKVHGFALDSTDVRSIKHVYATFFEAGTNINYNYRTGFIGGFTPYPTLGQLMTLTNADSVNMAFLADESRYQTVRQMNLRNLVVPVVGDFAGPKAIRAVGAWLKEKKANVAAFYLSNVEQYLYRSPKDVESFYENVATLPTDSTSTFIRSVPPTVSGTYSFSTNSCQIAYYIVQLVDSAGRSFITVTKDSAGRRVTTTTVDSSANRPRSPVQVFRTLQPPPAPLSSTIRMGGLVSGIAPIGATLQAFRSGTLDTYQALTAMTKVDGWK